MATSISQWLEERTLPVALDELAAKCAAPTMVPTWPAPAGTVWVACSFVSESVVAASPVRDEDDFDSLQQARPLHILWFALPESDPLLKSGDVSPN